MTLIKKLSTPVTGTGVGKTFLKKHLR